MRYRSVQLISVGKLPTTNLLGRIEVAGKITMFPILSKCSISAATDLIRGMLYGTVMSSAKKKL